MIGSLVHSLRALSTRLSWGALGFSGFSFFFYLAAGFRSYGERALGMALLSCSVGAAVALCAALSAAAFDLASPLFKEPIRLKTFIVSLVSSLAALSILLASSGLRAVFGGLSL